MNKRKIAKITGWSLILMALIAGFSIGYAYAEIYDPENSSALKENLLQNIGLYNLMLWGILAILILDLVISYTLYAFFKNVNRKIALLSGIIRMVYTLVFGTASVFLVKNLNVEALSNDWIDSNFQYFQTIWSLGLILFGVHLFLVGVLMKLHKRIPKILWYLTLIAGFSYAFVHLLKLTNLDSEFVSTLEMILSLPMAIGELGLAIWLIIRGGKDDKLGEGSAVNI